jgi:phage terminase small subunit
MLTDKQERFCQEYVVDLNSAAAARRAGYSEKTANRLGSRLLSNVDIQRRISELQDGRVKRCEITADEVVKKLRAISEMWPQNPSAACRALELLGKHIGLWDSRQQQAAVIPIQVILSQPVAERLAAETRPGVPLGELAAPDVA